MYLELNTGRRTKWHLSMDYPIVVWIITDIVIIVAYFTQNTVDQLRTIDDYPQLVMVHVPEGAYKCARNPKRPVREMNTLGGKPLHHHPYLYQVNST